MRRVRTIVPHCKVDAPIINAFQCSQCEWPSVMRRPKRYTISYEDAVRACREFDDHRCDDSSSGKVGREGDRILICTGEGSLKAKNTRRDPRVSLSIVDFHDPYQEAQLRGRVVERRPDGDFKYMDAISLKYTGKPFPFRSPEGRVALVIEIEKARYTKLPFEHTPPK